MNKEATELVKQYILSTAADSDGISKSSYELLGYMLQVDRNLASTICDVYELIEPEGARFTIKLDNVGDGYEL